MIVKNYEKYLIFLIFFLFANLLESIFFKSGFVYIFILLEKTEQILDPQNSLERNDGDSTALQGPTAVWGLARPGW